MANYLLEIGLEEMPAHLVTSAAKQLNTRLGQFLAEQRLDYADIKTFSTPRRLAVMVKGLADQARAVDEVIKGPAAKIAKTPEGEWSKAALGFARSQGVDVADLVLEADYYYAHKHLEGSKASEILIEVGQEVIGKMQFSTYMKWANHNFLFIRPIQWLVSLLDDVVIPFDILEDQANQITRGHRFLMDEPIVLKNALDYESQLESAFVIADAQKRKTMISEQIQSLASQHNWQVELHDDLLEEVNNLVEYPTAFVGQFDPKYLALPQEVLVTSMKDHQRYFEVYDEQGKLINHFVSVRNGNSKAIENVVAGNEKVLVARLEDAVFFWQEDQKLEIDPLVKRLEKVTFHEKIGSLRAHMSRVENLALALQRHLDLSIDLADIKRAASIYKFDLLTGMVGEFDELQGIMGEKYALLKGENPAVATAIREHYLPIAAGGDLPVTPLGSLLALADKLDTVLSFFAVNLIPSGSNDPYALRRATAGLVRIIADQQWSFDLAQFIHGLMGQTVEGLTYDNEAALIEFIKQRIAKQLEPVASKDIIQASLATDQLAILNLASTIETLEMSRKAPEFKTAIENLARVQKLAQKHEGSLIIDTTLFENLSETALYEANQTLDLTADSQQNISKLLSLSPLIEAYFADTMVMVDDKHLRQTRLSLLADLAAKLNLIADFDQIKVK